MAAIFGGRAYSARAWLTAVFVAVALILGGGGSPNPLTELLLELVFVVFAIAWLWLPAGSGAEEGSIDRLVLLIIAVPLVIPLLQLIPLPPSAWARLPFRQDAVAALSLVGQQDSWRPISLSPARTFSSLLAIVPAVSCAYAVARLHVHERRLVLAAILVMGIVTAALGAVQLVAGARGFNIYPEFHIGWVTGFQANRNAAADALLICLLALLALATPYLDGSRRKLPLSFDRKAFSFVVAALALVLTAALVMTGSRAGIALFVVPLLAVLVTTSLAAANHGQRKVPRGLLIALVVLVIALATFLFGFAHDTAIGRVANRFWVDDVGRSAVWQDTWFALKQYWPVGFGLGGFEPAMLAFERLEFVDPRLPNRAHNEYLEIGLEAGLLGYAMVATAAALIVALAWRAWRGAPGMHRQIVFGLSVLIVIGLHSIVDYPLRSMSLACLAGVAAGMLTRKRVLLAQSAAQDEGEMMKDPA